jgi:hypothetical protein
VQQKRKAVVDEMTHWSGVADDVLVCRAVLIRGDVLEHAAEKIAKQSIA